MHKNDDEIDYVKRLTEAARLRAEADKDDRTAEERSEDNPMFSDHLRRQAEHKRHLSNNLDGGNN